MKIVFLPALFFGIFVGVMSFKRIESKNHLNDSTFVNSQNNLASQCEDKSIGRLDASNKILSSFEKRKPIRLSAKGYFSNSSVTFQKVPSGVEGPPSMILDYSDTDAFDHDSIYRGMDVYFKESIEDDQLYGEILHVNVSHPFADPKDSILIETQIFFSEKGFRKSGVPYEDVSVLGGMSAIPLLSSGVLELPHPVATGYLDNTDQYLMVHCYAQYGDGGWGLLPSNLYIIDINDGTLVFHHNMGQDGGTLGFNTKANLFSYYAKECKYYINQDASLIFKKATKWKDRHKWNKIVSDMIAGVSDNDKIIAKMTSLGFKKFTL